MKKARFLFLLLLFINLTLFCQDALNEKTALKLSFKGYIKELLQTQQLKYAIVENGEVISEGILTNEFISMPKLENGEEGFIFIKPNNYPPSAIKLNKGEKVIKVEKIETREVKCDLSTFPKGAELCWFLKEWDEIPFDLFPLFKVEEINGKTIKLPLNKDATVEIRGKGLLPSYSICEAGSVTFKASPPTVGWGREVRVKNREGKWLNSCFCAFIKTPEPWMNEPPSGVAIPSDTFGRVFLKPEEAEERGMIVVLASGYKPFYLLSEKPTFEPLIITLEKGEKISGVVLGESGKQLKADIYYKMGFDNPLIKEGVVEMKTDNNGNFELPLPSLKDGFSLTFSADGYLLQTVDGNAIKSPLTIRLKKETPILGRVENKEGDPVSGAIVHFGEKEVVSDFQGNFVLKNIKKENSGWVEALGYFIKSFKIEPNENFLKITLEKGNGGIKAKLVDTEGNPVEEVTATAYYVSGESKITMGSGKRIYKNGNFQMVNSFSFGKEMPEVKADIVLFAKGFAPIVLTGIKMPKGEVIDLGTIVFERGYSVIGKVKLEDGSPAVGAKVTICQFREEDEKEAWQNARFEKYQSLWVDETNSSGEFKIDGLLFGSFALFIDYPNYPELEEQVDISKSGSIGEFVLKMGRDLVVKVFSKDGNPKENFLVKAFPATDLFGQDSKPASTSSDGSVVFKGLKDGSYKIEVYNPKNELIAKDSFELNEENTVKEIYLSGEKFEITVTFNEEPVSNQGFYIAAKPTGKMSYGYYLSDDTFGTSIKFSGNKIYKVSTDYNGVITLEDLEKGDYILFSGDFQFQTVRSFQINENNVAKVEIKGFNVSGKAVNSSGKPLANRIIPLFRKDSIGPPVIYTRSSSNGSFTFSNLEPGAYAIWPIYDKNKENSEFQFEISNSDIVLEPIQLEE